VVAVFFPGYFAGVAIRALFIRCWATVVNFPVGLSQFPKNWYQLTLRQDFRTPPDLIPGLPVDHQFNFAQMMKPDSVDKFNTIFRLFGFLFFFLPAIIYRISLKSTAWLYLPVIWMAHTPVKLREGDKQEVWINTARRGLFTLLSAICVLVYALYLAFDPDAYRAMQVANENQMLTPMHLIWAIDPAGWKLWFWVTIPSALLTVITWFWGNSIRGNLNAGGKLSWHSTQMRCLIAVNQVKNALIIAWMVMTLLSVARAGWLLGKLPAWMEPLFVKVILPVTSMWSS
jgi:hypothetical protein